MSWEYVTFVFTKNKTVKHVMMLLCLLCSHFLSILVRNILLCLPKMLLAVWLLTVWYGFLQEFVKYSFTAVHWSVILDILTPRDHFFMCLHLQMSVEMDADVVHSSVLNTVIILCV